MSMQNDRPQEQRPEAAPVQAPAPSTDQEEWIPLRDAVKDVAFAMSQYLFCNPRECIDPALQIVKEYGALGFLRFRAKRWFSYLNDPKRENYDVKRLNSCSGEIDNITMGFWINEKLYDNPFELSHVWYLDGIGFCAPYFCDDGEELEIYVSAFGVEVTRRGLPIIGDGADRSGAPSNEASDELEPLQKAMRLREVRGRPRKWDWEGAWAALVAEAHTPDGLPEGEGAQARIARIMANWFQQKYGEEPADSEIRKRAAAVLEAIALRRKINFRQFPAISGGQGLA